MKDPTLYPDLGLTDPLGRTGIDQGVAQQSPTPITTNPGDPVTNQPPPLDPGVPPPPIVPPTPGGDNNTPTPIDWNSGGDQTPPPPVVRAQPEGNPVTTQPPPSTPPASTNPIPTLPGGGQVGGGIPWDPGSSAPNYSPPGYHWDPSLAMFQPNPGGTTQTGSNGAPTGGALTDPGYVQQLVTYWGTQPGVNPSVKNDPQYWINRILQVQGQPGTPNDQGYWESRFMTPEGPPEGANPSGGPAGAANPSAASTSNPPNDTLAQVVSQLGGNLFSPNNPAPFSGPVASGSNSPFSQLIAGGYGSMLGSGGAGISPLGNDVQTGLDSLLFGGNSGAGGGTAALEGARGQFQGAHNAMLSQAEADLANRGLLSMPGSAQGPETTSLDYIMRDLAPAFDQSMGNFLTNAYGQAVGLTENNNANFLGALKGAGDYQNQISQIALQTLATNNAFNEFVAQFGLDRDQVLYQIASGQNTNLANLLAQYLAQVNTAGSGHV